MTHVRRPNRRRVAGLDALVNGGSCTASGGKIRYLDERTADVARGHVAAKDPDGDRLEAYRCGSCRDWHIGHRSPDRG